jgi:hypothetical protein
MSWPAQFYEAHPVMLGLRNVFEQLAQQEDAAALAAAAAAWQGPGSSGTGATRTAVDPTDLRLALASSADRTFGLGEWQEGIHVWAFLLLHHLGRHGRRRAATGVMS